jgi:tetratricopeptide (TPR) repeat protein
MKMILRATMAAALLAGPVLADQKLDEAIAKANEQVEKGKPEDAIKTLKKQGDGPEAQMALGHLQVRLGNLDDALAAYNTAVAGATGATKAKALGDLALLSLWTGPAQTALGYAEQGVQAASNPESLGILARILTRVDPAKALKTAEQAIAAGPTSAAAQDGYGAALVRQGRGADAAAAFRKALQADPSMLRARLGLVGALILDKKPAEALAEARKATTEAPNSAEAHAVLGVAMIADNPKAWGEAIAEVQEGAFKNPKNAEIQVAVAQVFEADGRFDQAAAAYEHALAIDPGYTSARASIVNDLFLKGALDRAVEEAKKLVAADSNNGDAQRVLGEMLLRKQDFAGAVAPLEKAVRALPGDADANYYLGRAYQFTGKVPESLAPYKRAAELAPKNLEYQTTYGLVLGMNQQYDEGAKVLQKVVSTPGYKDAAGFINLGWVYWNMQPPKTAEAITNYKKGLELDPKSAQAAIGLGWAYSNAKQPDEAIAAFQKAMQLEPKLAAEAHKGIAWAYTTKKDFENARKALDKAEEAGGGDQRLSDLLDKVEKMKAEGKVFDEKAAEEAEQQRQAALEAAAKADKINQLIGSQNPATRLQGVKQLVTLGATDAVPTLTWMLVNDKDYSVKIAVANALGSFGGAARKACPHLKNIANAPAPAPNPFATPEETAAEMRAADLKRACRDAVARIGC